MKTISRRANKLPRKRCESFPSCSRQRCHGKCKACAAACLEQLEPFAAKDAASSDKDAGTLPEPAQLGVRRYVTHHYSAYKIVSSFMFRLSNRYPGEGTGVADKLPFYLTPAYAGATERKSGTNLRESHT